MMEDDVRDFLEHFGVKGMHWGVRNDKKPLTAFERAERSKRRARILVNTYRIAAAGLFVASIMSSKGSTRVNTVKPKSKSVTDLINETRQMNVDRIMRTHKEGHIDAEQAKNFINVINARYDRKVAEAVKSAVS